jgi:general secretion pathway protein A
MDPVLTMYQQAFGLTKNPFNLTPDPSFLYLNGGHREALAGLTYAITGRKGFVLLIGEAGTGKTTLLSRIMTRIPASHARFSLILNPKLTPAEFLELVLVEFGITGVPSSKAQRILKLQQFLAETARAGRAAVLVVDEAHGLSPELLEEIRLLGNFECADRKLLQIVLSGQSELGQMLNREDLRQLKQRIAVRLSLHPLSSQEVGRYIQHRWSKAGGSHAAPFSPEAVTVIAQQSKAIPRLVNSICDSALMLALAQGARSIGAPEILEVCRDLDLLFVTATNGNGTIRKNGASLQATRLPAHAPLSIPTLERYSPAPKRSFLARWFGKPAAIDSPSNGNHAAAGISTLGLDPVPGKQSL